MTCVELVKGDINSTLKDVGMKGLGTMVDYIFLMGFSRHDLGPSLKVGDVDFLLEAADTHNMDNTPLDMHVSAEMGPYHNLMDVFFLSKAANTCIMDKPPLDVHASTKMGKSNFVPNEDSCYLNIIMIVRNLVVIF